MIALQDPWKDFRLVSYVEKHDAGSNMTFSPKQIIHEQGYPSSLKARMMWVGKLLASIRLDNWRINHTSHDRHQPVTPGFSSQRRFLAHAVLSFVRGFVVLDLTRSYIDFDAYFVDVSVSIRSPLPFPAPGYLSPQLFRTMIIGAQAWALIGQMFYLPAAIPVGLNALGLIPDRLSPHNWPSYFGSPIAIFKYGVRGFWGTFWHQTMRWSTTGPGYAVADSLCLTHKSLLRYAILSISAFGFSGIVHMGLVPPEPLYASVDANTIRLNMAAFFWLQAMAVTLEALTARIAIAMSGAETWSKGSGMSTRMIVNCIWTIAWFSFCLPLLGDAARQMGYWRVWPLPHPRSIKELVLRFGHADTSSKLFIRAYYLASSTSGFPITPADQLPSIAPPFLLSIRGARSPISRRSSMENLDFSQQDGLLDFGSAAFVNTAQTDENRAQTYPPFYHNIHSQPIWSGLGMSPLDGDMTHSQFLHPQDQTYAQQPQGQRASRPNSNHGRQPIPLQTHHVQDFNTVVPNSWQMQFDQAALRQQQECQAQYDDAARLSAATYAAFSNQMHTSPVDLMPVTSAAFNTMTTSADDAAAAAAFMSMTGPMDSMNTLGYPLNDYQLEMASAFNLQLHQQAAERAQASLSNGSPTGTILEVQSLSDGEWTAINFNPQRQSFDSLSGTVSNPSQNLHIRTSSGSSSSEPDSAQLSGSYEEIPHWPLSSPQDEFHSETYIDLHFMQRGLPIPGVDQHHTSPDSSLAVSPSSANATTFTHAASSSTSPSSSGANSPPSRRRKTSGDKVTKVIVKKTIAHTTRKDASAEKKVGKRRGPLRPDQRQQAHEIRKLRACLRCKFLKKTCDKGEPCGGCRPSHARLWQVPCTRLDIKDISYFMKDWKADYERHVSLGFSVHNIKGFSTVERTLYITHGYGHYIPVKAREVFVREDKCFDVNWVESIHETPREFEINTAKLSVGLEGVSTAMLSDYLDRHLDSGFEAFVDEYFEGTVFLTEILKTVYNYYRKAKTPAIRKALKLVLAYNLTLHLTMVEGLSEEEHFTGRIDDPGSRFNGKTFAPVMINFQIKCALAEMWRELQKDILEELSALYSSVYSGEKLKNWPTIFMLATILLAIWEEMQFDCHYRVPDESAVNKFCDDMETTPVGVIVGLFQAISTKLPAIYEWDTTQHQHLLGSDMAICDALTEVKGHVHKYEGYLRERATTAKFDREDFDCLSNKFLSKLVIRAN
ncbi:hypothetical protein AMS68_004835 [Peltaster fructicola]|uniref:Wax synthase domain-containing protein n=1 Tax=Peltaster fructicola TaxID=286661 RepID=A0A6H0XXJ8_9PEZI|nr:hypothetical protein AMS68_004835 [Peltaster fructicola]